MLAAWSHELPHINESRSLHDVCGWHVVPRGHSESSPLGHGREHSRVASSKLAPQKLEPTGVSAGGSTSAHVVYEKHVRSSGHSSDRPVGQGSSQLASASRKFEPQ